MSLRAESVLLGRSAIIAGWVIGAVGVLLTLASMAGWTIIILNQKPPAPLFFEVDRTTGIVSEPVGAQDAPKLFSEATDQEYLKRYIMACEQWVPQMDRQNDRICKLMSTPEEQARYMARRAKPTSPQKAIGPNGYVELDNFRFHVQAYDKATNTHRYWVQYERTVWKGSTKEQSRSWSATVDFQFHPEVPMLPRDRPDNKPGFQAVSFSVTPDTPDAAEQPK